MWIADQMVIRPRCGGKVKDRDSLKTMRISVPSSIKLTRRAGMMLARIGTKRASCSSASKWGSHDSYMAVLVVDLEGSRNQKMVRRIIEIAAWVTVAFIVYATLVPLGMRPTVGDIDPDYERFAAYAVASALM